MMREVDYRRLEIARVVGKTRGSDSLRPLHLEKMEVDQHRRVFEVF